MAGSYICSVQMAHCHACAPLLISLLIISLAVLPALRMLFRGVLSTCGLIVWRRVSCSAICGFVLPARFDLSDSSVRMDMPAGK